VGSFLGEVWGKKRNINNGTSSLTFITTFNDYFVFTIFFKQAWRRHTPYGITRENLFLN
jgi:hypothetical protein